MGYLSQYVHREREFEHSQTAMRNGIGNRMNDEQLANAKYLCKNVVDIIREHYNRAALISSGFRGECLNILVRGSKSSQHCKGEAVDFTIAGVSIEKLFQDIKTGKIKGKDGNPIPFDQVIQEFGGWVHISVKRNGGNRRQPLRALRRNGHVVYKNA